MTERVEVLKVVAAYCQSQGTDLSFVAGLRDALREALGPSAAVEFIESYLGATASANQKVMDSVGGMIDTMTRLADVRKKRP